MSWVKFGIFVHLVISSIMLSNKNLFQTTTVQEDSYNGSKPDESSSETTNKIDSIDSKD